MSFPTARVFNKEGISNEQTLIQKGGRQCIYIFTSRSRIPQEVKSISTKWREAFYAMYVRRNQYIPEEICYLYNRERKAIKGILCCNGC